MSGQRCVQSLAERYFSMSSKPRLSLNGGALGVLVILLLVGCNTQPRATTAESMELIKKVYTACNTKNTERLEKAEAELKTLVDQQLISEDERVEFESIITQAREGQWEKAQNRALSFAEAQVR
jgi:hypothetical protein